MHFLKFFILVAMLFPAFGCAISPGPETLSENMCRFKRHSLEVDVRGDPARAIDLEPTFAAALSENYAALNVERGDSTISPSLLVLSGGSQDGAFGAGFLSQWARERSGGLPRFTVVTGISTGAILSTFAFLNQPELAESRYAIDEEAEVLKRFVRSGGGKISLFDIPIIARKGALGDLSPLRSALRDIIDGPMLKAIAAEKTAGRALYMGAVDVDTGKAVIFDMTDMASRFDERLGNLEHVRNCYVEAIMASSSVPLAAPPAFIDNRMYIDGGARFGVFSDEIGDVIDQKSMVLADQFKAQTLLHSPERSIISLGVPHLYTIVNGTLNIRQKCGKDKNSDDACLGGYGALAGKHADWDLLALAERSVSILINQTYRFSTLETMKAKHQAGFQPHLERILPNAGEHIYTMDDATLGSGTKSCDAWRKEDIEKEKPVEFHPRFMRCLVAYGRSRATKSKWATME